MKYPVRVYEVDRAAGPTAKPSLKDEFQIISDTLEGCRKAVAKRVAADGYELRTLSFSPEPSPYGSVVVYVWSDIDPAKIKPQEDSRRKKRRRR